MFQRVADKFAKSGLDRVMGYHRPVSEFNIGKKKEFAQRKGFIVNEKTIETPKI